MTTTEKRRVQSFLRDFARPFIAHGADFEGSDIIIALGDIELWGFWLGEDKAKCMALGPDDSEATGIHVEIDRTPVPF